MPLAKRALAASVAKRVVLLVKLAVQVRRAAWVVPVVQPVVVPVVQPVVPVVQQAVPVVWRVWAAQALARVLRVPLRVQSVRLAS